MYDPVRAAEQIAKANAQAQAAPGDATAHYTLAALLWNKLYHEKTLSATERQHDLQWGLTAADEAIRLRPQYDEAMLYKALLLRVAASHETDASRKQALSDQAAGLQEQAVKIKQAASPWAAVPANAIRVGKTIQPPKKIKDVKPEYPAEARDAKAQGVVILEVVIGEDGRVQAKRILRSVPPFDDAALAAVGGWEFTPTLVNGVPVPVVMAVTVNFTLAGGVPPPPLPPPPPPPPPPSVKDAVSLAYPGAVRVTGDIKPPARVKDVKPVYPPEARDARIQGVVIVEAVIDEAGKVRDTRVLRSVPGLDEAALEAVRQWEFTPTVLAGKPVPVIMTMTVNFTLK